MEQTLLRHEAPPRTPARPPGRRARRQERRRLVARDRLSARLAELETIKQLLARAAVRVQRGWCQNAWVAPADAVCLVSAIRASGPELPVQAVDRAVDVAWHALHQDAAGIRWVPAPTVRLARVRDLARWNDRRSRTLPQVVALLDDAARYADGELVRLRS